MGNILTSWESCVGYRCLIKENRFISDIVEVEVLEVSPSGKYVKFRTANGNTTWELSDSRCLVEKLPEPEIDYPR